MLTTFSTFPNSLDKMNPPKELASGAAYNDRNLQGPERVKGSVNINDYKEWIERLFEVANIFSNNIFYYL